MVTHLSGNYASAVKEKYVCLYYLLYASTTDYVPETQCAD